MKGFRKRIIAFFISAMMIMGLLGSVAVSADDSIEVKGTIATGTQTVELEVDRTNRYEYKPTVSQKQSIVITAEDGFAVDTILRDEDGAIKQTYVDTEVILTHDFESGKTYYLELYIYPTFSPDEVTLVPVIGNATIEIGEPVHDIRVYEVDNAQERFVQVGKNNVSGLSWDRDELVLTMENYNPENKVIWISNRDAESQAMVIGEAGESKESVVSGEKGTTPKEDYPKISDEPEVADVDIDINIKGKNTFKKGGIVVGQGVHLIISGDGELNLEAGDIANSVIQFVNIFGSGYLGANFENKLTIDGPRINITGQFGYNVMSVGMFEMKSGRLYMEISPEIEYRFDVISGQPLNYDGDTADKGFDLTGARMFARYGSVTVEKGIDITGGRILVKYIAPPENSEFARDDYNNIVYPIFDNYKGDINVENATVIIAGDDDVAFAHGEPKTEIGTVNIDDSALYLIGGDISGLDAKLSETSYEYDGNEKKPSVTIKGLIEGEDYEVSYKDNVEAGTATVTVKGIGLLKGTIIRTFEITKEEEAVPKKGTIIRDKKYIYKVVKEGSKDGKTVGELAVTGLKRKSLRQIKIAAVVTIKGVKYKVTSVSAKAFKGNKKITKVMIGKNVKSIGTRAFSNCPKLKQVTINSTKLKTIGAKAFYKDSKLNKVILKSAKLKKVGKNAFKKTDSNLKIKVLKNKKKAYTKLFKKAGNKKVRVR